MEKHACKLCNRRFPNGRALGGHMRSHVMANGGKKRALQDSSASSSLSPYAAGGESSVVLPDGESETESSKAPPLRRSKRRPRASEQQHSEADPGTASSVSDTAPEDDVARCLMMLSRDDWTRSSKSREEEFLAESVKSRARSKRIHQCSICFRIFNSGQALGGHKRSHLMNNSASTVAAGTDQLFKSTGETMLDLNQPPEEEGELSAVSCTQR